MLKATEEYIRQHNMINPGDRVAVALSGGADSICLLLLLESLSGTMGFSLEAVHVEHGIRGSESRQDQEFVEKVCADRGISLRVYPVDVPVYAAREGLGLEEAARILRYRAFKDYARENNAVIAVAHHLEDNCETVLFQMIRGSGIRGMSGISPVSERDGVRYIRPILFWTREEVEHYLRGQKQSYVTDTTNSDVQYSRNKLRHQVIPLLKEINAGAVEHINQSAGMLMEISDYIDSMTRQAAEKLVLTEEREAGKRLIIPTASLKELHPAIQKNLLMYMISEMAGRRKDIGSSHVKSLMELCNSQSGRSIHLPYGLVARKQYDDIILEGQAQMFDGAGKSAGHVLYSGRIEPGESMEIDCPKPAKKLTLTVLPFHGNMDKIPKKPYTKWIDYDKIKDVLTVRMRQSGDYFVSDKSGHHKKIKEFFINEKIPLEERNLIPLIADGSEILCIPGYRINYDYRVREDTVTVLEIHLE